MNLKVKRTRRKLIKVLGSRSNWRDLNGSIIIKKSRVRLALIIGERKVIRLSLVRRNKLRSRIVKKFKFEKPRKNLGTLVPKRLYRRRRKLKKTLAKKLKRLINRRKRLRLKNFLKFRNKFFEKKPIFNKSYSKTKQFAAKLGSKFKTKRKYLLLNSLKGIIKNNSSSKEVKIEKLKLTNTKRNKYHHYINGPKKKRRRFEKKRKLKKTKQINSVKIHKVNFAKGLNIKRLYKIKASLLQTLKKKFKFSYRGVRILMHRKLRKLQKRNSPYSFPIMRFWKKLISRNTTINSKVLLKEESRLSVKNDVKELKSLNIINHNKKGSSKKKINIIKKWIKIFIRSGKLHPFFFNNVLKSLHFFRASKSKKLTKWSSNYLRLLKNVDTLDFGTSKQNFLPALSKDKLRSSTKNEDNLKQKNLSQVKRLKILLFYKKTTKKRIRKITVNPKIRHLKKFKRSRTNKYWPWWQILWKHRNEKRKKRKESKFTNLLFDRKRRKKKRHSPLNLWRQNYVNNKFLRAFYVCKIKELKKFFSEHQKQKKGDSGSLLFFMEKRILTFLFRINLFNSIYFIKQLIRHGCISINGKIIKKETYKMSLRDELEIVTKSKAHKKKWMLQTLLNKMYVTHLILNYPKYIEMNYKLLKGKFIRSPKREEIYFTNNTKLNRRFYI